VNKSKSLHKKLRTLTFDEKSAVMLSNKSDTKNTKVNKFGLKRKITST
jgi:hypothetical protein